MIKQEHTQRHTIDEEAVIDSLAHRKHPRRRKWDLETVSEIWNRPRYAGGSVTSANRPKARGGSWTDTVRVTDKGAENPQGVNYYFDEDGNIVNSVNGRKGQIKLDETVINQYSPKVMRAVSDYLTASNDATALVNGKPQNIHLKDRAVQGAESYAAWAKDNPALNKFGLALGAAPFIAPVAASAWQVFPYLSNSYLLGRVGSTLAGRAGSAVGGAIGNGIDLGLSGMGAYNGVKTLADSNADAFDKTLGVVNGVASALPLWNTGRMAFRSSFADNVVPMAYNNEPGQALYTKGEQLKRTFAETFKKVATLRANEAVSENPYWMTRLNPNNYDNVNGTLASGRENFSYRQDAINMAMKQPVYNNTYIRNADGTYSYNSDVVTQPEYIQVVKRFKDNHTEVEPFSPKYLLSIMKDGETKTIGDNFAGNAGYATLLKENGKLYIVDDWDVQPYKDAYRLPPGKFAKFMHKFFPNAEVVKIAGGKPFTLKHQINTDY